MRPISYSHFVLVLLLALAACAPIPPQESITKETPEPEPVVLHECGVDHITTLDPQLADEFGAISVIENLFVHLTNFNDETNEIEPEAATAWEISEDSRQFTFHLRDDIPWVEYDPESGEVRLAVDNEGQARMLTAFDFVYGIRRACDPSLGSYYSSIVAPLIKGCEAILFAEDPAKLTEDEYENIGVHAPDDHTLVIDLAFPASYFLSMTPMWTLTATPQWAIAQHGETWIEAENIVTNGRYVLEEWTHGVRMTWRRNPQLPIELYGEGNIDTVIRNVVPDESTCYALWQNDLVARAMVPLSERESHLSAYPEEVVRFSTLGVSFIGFRTSKPPFDAVHVRRAFSAAIDRERYVRDVLGGTGEPMIHFAPPGIFGAPPIDEVGVGFDPEYAQKQLAEAGYPGCDGFPLVSLASTADQMTFYTMEFLQAQWEEHLGCASTRIQLERLEIMSLLSSIAYDAPDETAPHMWVLAWGADYPDENNWVGDVLWCKAEGGSKRTCSELDDLIVEARMEPDPDRRIDLYRRIEEGFFGPEGEFPLAPINLWEVFGARHSWLQMVPAIFSGDKIYDWRIDQAAQHAALERQSP